MTKEEIEQYFWNFCVNKGLSEETTSAIMGNIYAESGFNPDIVEGGSGVGYGLCQWSYGRRTQLESYGTSINHQFHFFWSELTGENTELTGADLQWINPPDSSVTGGTSFSCTLNEFLEGNEDIEFLTTAFCYCWERPAPETNHLDTRIEKALEYYEEYGGTGGGGEPIEPPEPEPVEPSETTTVMLKNNYRYGMEDSLFGKKIIPIGKEFTLDKIVGNIAYIKQDTRSYKVNKNNLIYIVVEDEEENTEENEE